MRRRCGVAAAALVESHWASWIERGPAPVEDWLFSPSPGRHGFVTADALSHKFRRLGIAAGVERPALHRLRHAVATQLVGDGRLLQAQARRGHRDPTTTLRHHARAVARHDEDVADSLDELLNGRACALATDASDQTRQQADTGIYRTPRTKRIRALTSGPADGSIFAGAGGGRLLRDLAPRPARRRPVPSPWLATPGHYRRTSPGSSAVEEHVRWR